MLTMTRRTSRARRHLSEIERRLDVLERRVRALEDLRTMLQHRSGVAVRPWSQLEVLQEV